MKIRRDLRRKRRSLAYLCARAAVTKTDQTGHTKWVDLWPVMIASEPK